MKCTKTEPKYVIKLTNDEVITLMGILDQVVDETPEGIPHREFADLLYNELTVLLRNK